MIYAAKDNLMSFDEAFDLCVVQKILPKISGSSNEVLDMLFDIFELFNDYRFSNREYLEEKELKELKEKVTDSNKGSDKINYKFKVKLLRWSFILHLNLVELIQERAAVNSYFSI